MKPAVEVSGLRLRYESVTALDDISLTIDGNKIYGLLGRNGSGKTSLLSVVAAFRKATAGTVLVNGQPVFENPQATSGICLIRDSVDLGDGSYSVSEALSHVAYLRHGWDAEYAAELLDRFKVPLRTKVGRLSRGQRSAVGVVVGLASRAPLTMFDEAHLGMDAPARYAFYDELLNEFAAHPRTFILATHLIEEVARLFEEVMIIDRGRLLLHEHADALRSRGVSVTGPTEQVVEFVAGRTVLGEKRLGPTTSAMVYGVLGDDDRRRARASGLDIDPIGLQDLFVYLTQSAGVPR